MTTAKATETGPRPERADEEDPADMQEDEVQEIREPEIRGPDLPAPRDSMELAAHLIHHCRACPLGMTRTNAVPGEGPPDAEVMIIAEGPGRHEDEQGRPFVGPAGKLLDQLLQEAGLDRDEVYITNMIKCRAPDNRDPEPEELAACSKHLDRQINILQPRMIITLGKFSLARFLPGETSVTKIRGKLRHRRGQFIYPIIHPAAGLRRGEYKQMIEEDFRNIPAVLKRIRENPPEEEPEPQFRLTKAEPEAKQPTMF